MKFDWKKYISLFTDHSLDFRVRLFHVLALGGIIGSLLTMLISLHSFMLASAAISLILMVLSGGLIVYTNQTGNYQRAYMITILVIFLIFFPVLFFASGGHRSGMPSVFLFAVIFTVLMLEGRRAITIPIIEILVYSMTCVIAYRHPELVVQFETEYEILVDIIFAYSCVGMICAVVLFLHLKEYVWQREQLKEQNERLKHYDEAKSTFLTTVAHEIKNPLLAISANARDTFELLDEEPQDMEQMKENLKIIEQTVMRIDRIVVDLMDTVSIEQGRLALSLGPVRISELLSEAVTIWLQHDPSAALRQNEILFDVDDSLPAIQADYERLLQVITNLLSNASRYTNHGQITLSVSQKGNYQLIKVADTGEGMSEVMRQNALKGYVSASRDYWRHGIGLYVCHQIVEAHGGDIWIDSELGKGTCVSFTLPDEGGIS